MTRLALTALVALFAIACASGSAQENAVQLTWSGDTVVAELRSLRDFSDSSRGDAPLRPMAVRAGAGLLFVSDLGTDRVAILDSAANARGWIGTRGRGPGELYGVSHLAVQSDRLFVGEALNGRVSEFTLTGRFVRVYASPFAAGALSVSRRGIVTAAQSNTHYATFLGSVDPPPVLPRTRSRVRSKDGRWTALPGHDLIASDSASTWVLDQGTARICRYGTPNAIAQCAALPPDLLTRLRQYRDDRVTSIEAATHLRVQSAPIAKDMIRVGAWLALLLPLPELPIVLIDTAQGTLAPVVFTHGELPAWVRAGRSFAWDTQGFVVVSDEAIGRLSISRTPPSQ
jgi:hypothetical protein